MFKFIAIALVLTSVNVHADTCSDKFEIGYNFVNEGKTSANIASSKVDEFLKTKDCETLGQAYDFARDSYKLMGKGYGAFENALNYCSQSSMRKKIIENMDRAYENQKRSFKMVQMIGDGAKEEGCN